MNPSDLKEWETNIQKFDQYITQGWSSYGVGNLHTLLASLEKPLRLKSFTHDTAWKLGTTIRELALKQYPTSTLHISITSTTSVLDPSSTPLILFQTCTGPDFTPDHMSWLERKRNTILRFGCSNLVMRNRHLLDSDGMTRSRTGRGGIKEYFTDQDAQEDMCKTYGLDGRKYVTGGGGLPIMVVGVGGVAGTVVVHGLRQEINHALAIKGLKEVVVAGG